MKSINKLTYLFAFAFGIGVVFFVHTYYYYPFLSDDALISLRYAERFIEGNGLNWNDSEYVEGYSNLLWILIISGMGYIGMDLVDTIRFIGFTLFLLIPLIALYIYIYKYGKQLNQVIIPVSSYVFAAPIAVWAIGGLEQPLLAFLLTMSIICFLRYCDNPSPYFLIVTSINLGLMVLTRPDAPLIVIAFAVTFLLITKLSQNARIISAVIVTIAPALFVIGQLLFRLNYYGEFLPNTAFVKLTPAVNHFLNGLLYIGGAFAFMSPFLLIIIRIIWKNFKNITEEPLLVLTIVLALIYLPYLIFIGGDVFPAYRHFVVIFVLFFFVLIRYSEQVHDLIKSIAEFFRIKNLNIMFVLIITSFALLQFGNHESRRAKHERWEWIGKELGETLNTVLYDAQPLVAVTAAGCIPYWSKLPTLDMLGLNDKHIAKNHPENIGSGMLGHELGDADYILGRKPDLIIFNVGEYPTFRPGRDLVKRIEFHKLYKPVKIFLPENQYYSKVFFRLNSAKTGANIEGDEITIPGYLFADTLNVHSQLIGSKLVLCLYHNQSTSFELDGIEDDYELSHIEQNHEKVYVQTKKDGNWIKVTLKNLSSEVNYVENVKLKKVQ